MRTLRVTLTGAVTLMLIGGLSAAIGGTDR